MGVRFWPSDAQSAPSVRRIQTQIDAAETALTEVYEGQLGIDAQLTDTQIAVAELYEMVTEDITALQMAVVEMYEGGAQ